MGWTFPFARRAKACHLSSISWSRNRKLSLLLTQVSYFFGMKMYKHLNPRLLGFSLGTTFVVPNPCFYFLQIIENDAFVIFDSSINQENKKLGLGS